MDGPLHIDIWSCSPREQAAFLMFATGPMELNLRQRQHAKRNGMALSQIGLLDRATGRQLDTGESEQEIYELLGLPYLTPSERQAYVDQDVRRTDR